MNKTLAISVFSLILSGFLALPPLASADFGVNLKLGARGQAVTEVQDLLVDEKCLGVAPTGYFGKLTSSAVKCFQTKHLLPSTGYWGPMTRTVANTILAAAITESNEAEVAETGTSTPAATENTFGSIEARIDEINRKFNEEVQRKLAAEAQAKAAQDALKAQVDTVVTNTTPAPAPVVPPSPPSPQATTTPIIRFSPGTVERVAVYLEVGTDQAIFCGNKYATTCKLDGQLAVKSVLDQCNATLDKGYYLFDTGKTYTCELRLANSEGIVNHYKHTFTVPSN